MPFPNWLSGGRTDLTDRVRRALELADEGEPGAGERQVSREFSAALKALKIVRGPRDTSRLQIEAAWLYRSGEMEAAEGAAEESLQGSDNAWTWNLLGKILVWTGDLSRAQGAFGRAARLRPDVYVVPYRVSRERFDAMAERALQGIPERYQLELGNTLIVTDDLPSIEMVREGEDPDLLGIYEGATALEHGLPERIVLYQRNHENLSADEATLVRLVEETMRHEAGHHFGMDEDELPY